MFVFSEHFKRERLYLPSRLVAAVGDAEDGRKIAVFDRAAQRKSVRQTLLSPICLWAASFQTAKYKSRIYNELALSPRPTSLGLKTRFFCNTDASSFKGSGSFENLPSCQCRGI